MYPLLDKNPVEGIIWTIKQEELHGGHVLSTKIYTTVVFVIFVPLQEFKYIDSTSTTRK